LLLDRSRRAGRYLEWKVRLFTVGALLALVGMYLEQRWMTGAAIGVLALGMGLRFLPGGRERHGTDVDDGDDDAGSGVGPS